MPDSALAQFIAEHKITAVAEPAPAPDQPTQWDRDASHWTVTLSSCVLGEPLVVPFHQGSAHTEPPTAAEVLYCVALDSSLGDNDFEEFCANLGYDTDSRRAYGEWEACKAERERLVAFLGGEVTLEALIDAAQDF